MNLSSVMPIVPIIKSIWFRSALIAVLVLAGPAAAIGYFFYTSQPAYLMAKGSESLAQGNLDQAKQIADRLQRKGHDSAAHILRGRILLYQAREQLEKAPPPFPYEGMQRTAQMVLGGAALNGCPWALGGPSWLTAVQVQQPFPRHIPGVEDFLDAFEEFSQVLDDDPWAAEATVLGAECLVRLGDYRSAEHALSTVVYRQPDNLDAHRYLAAIYIDVNATALAMPQLREWIRLDANDPQPYRWLSDLTRSTETGIPEAIDAYRKLLQLNLDDSERAEVGMKLAEVLSARLAEYQQALDTLAEVPKSFQDRTSFVLLRAECLQGLGKGDEARNLVDAMLKEHPTYPNGLLFRAKIYLQEDQPQSAIALLERLLALHPNIGVARRNLILAYRLIGDKRRAAEQEQLFDAMEAKRRRARELRSAVAREPGNGSARLEMAILNLSDNPSEALTWIRFALASSPEDPKIRKTWTQLYGYQPPPVLRDFQRLKQAKINY